MSFWLSLYTVASDFTRISIPNGCNHYIRVRRMVNSKRWIVTKYVMHDNWNGHSHKQIKHELYTPTAQHMRMVTTIAKQEAELTCRPARAAVESQILQNPKINQFASVPGLQGMEGNTRACKGCIQAVFDEYLDKIWRKKYGLEMLNCQGSFVMDNNYSEGWNRKTLIDLGKRETWWIFLWNTKRYMQVVVAKYNGFKHNGFQRQRGSDRRKRCKALKTIWNTFEEKNRQNKDVIWNYLECLYLCWEQEYDALYSKLDSL
eukprot:935737_1